MTWINRISAARQAGSFTADDKDAARDWRACAWAEQDSRIPRTSKGVPQDAHGQFLGYLFTASVVMDNFDSAQTRLEQIQQRALEIYPPLDAVR